MQSECVNNIRQAQRSVPEALLVRYEGWEKRTLCTQTCQRRGIKAFSRLCRSIYYNTSFSCCSHKNDYGHKRLLPNRKHKQGL